MKTQILIMCAMLSLGLGCKKEADQIDRYKVFTASWQLTPSSSSEAEKRLVKVDSVTGRVWYWESAVDTSDLKAHSGWTEMTNNIAGFSP
jgi:hypothetical protein